MQIDSSEIKENPRFSALIHDLKLRQKIWWNSLLFFVFKKILEENCKHFHAHHVFLLFNAFSFSSFTKNPIPTSSFSCYIHTLNILISHILKLIIVHKHLRKKAEEEVIKEEEGKWGIIITCDEFLSTRKLPQLPWIFI